MDVQKPCRRRHRRISIDLQVGIIHAGTFTFAEAASLSEGGLMVRTSLPIKVGNEMQVQLLLWSEVVSADAEAVYVLSTSEHGTIEVGVKFTKAGFRTVSLLRSFVRYHDREAE